MKTWHVIVLLVLFAAGELFVLLYPFGPRTESVVQRSTTPSPARTATRHATLVFAGDVMLSRSVGDMMARISDWRWPFERIASVTAGADLAFANLETSISTHGAPNGCGYCFRADPRVVQGLTYAGFDVLSVANNHAHDYGPEAFADTLTILRAAEISPVGDDSMLVRTVNGVRVGYLAYSHPLDQERIVTAITAARSQADILIVSLHDGTEYETAHNAEQERVYQAAVDAGADLVVGTHPHVVQELVRYPPSHEASDGHVGWIAYSLGNFVFDQNFSSATMHGMLLTATVDSGRITDVASRSVTISAQYQPFLP